MNHGRVYGLLAEFDDPQRLVAAVRRTYEAEYREIDTFTPYPVEGVAEEMGLIGSGVPAIVLSCGIFGGLIAYGFQFWVSVVDYPLNIGGRPLHSWPSFIPVTFELTVLGAAIGGVIGMLVMNGLPRPHHPLFNVPEFALASRNRFFLCIKSRDARFDLDATRRFLSELEPTRIVTVPLTAAQARTENP